MGKGEPARMEFPILLQTFSEDFMLLEVTDSNKPAILLWIMNDRNNNDCLLP